MISIVNFVSSFLALFIVYFVANRLGTYVLNVFKARKTGLPIVYGPPLAQNAIFWVIAGPISRPWLKKKLPAWLYNRIVLTVYGVEFFQKDQPWREYVEPQLKANPKLRGEGKSYILVTGGRLELWTYDPELAKQITTRPNDFPQFDAASIVMNVFGTNVLTTDGAEWSRHRRIVAGAVTERVSPIVWSESIRQTRALIASITNDSDDSTPGSGTTNAMFDLIKRVTIHVLYAAGMGNKQDFASSAQEEVPAGAHLSFFDAVKMVNENAAGCTVIPTSILLNWPSWAPGAEWLRRLGHAKIDFPKYTVKALNEEKERSAASKSDQPRNNIMSALVAASERNEGDLEEGAAKRKGPALSEQELIGNLYIFTAAGFDTTANSISYTILLLARYPKWQDWLIEEIDALLGDDPDADFEYTSIFPKAHRALAVLLETDRLYPPVIHLAKMVRLPQIITTSTCGTFSLPGMMNVYVNSIMLHKIPETWRNLNMTPLELASRRDDEDGILGDEHDYRPSRWINPQGSSSPIFQPPKGSYMTWSAGPRVCPGMKMAHVEFVGILITLFSKHRLEVTRKMVPVKGAPEVLIPESDDALRKRLDDLIETSTPKLTLEMDVYDTKPGEERGLSVRWVKRR